MTKEFNQFRWESSISERLKNNLKSVEYVQNNEEVKLQQDEFDELLTEFVLVRKEHKIEKLLHTSLRQFEQMLAGAVRAYKEEKA